MCYAQGSVEHMTSRCSMCQLFPPQKNQCPHVPLAVCTNRQNHPRFNVVHFRSAEVPAFAGCGYCKYARRMPFPNPEAAWYNPGWPGCCRPPRPNEVKWIQPLDWPPIASLYQIPIPDEIKNDLQEQVEQKSTESVKATDTTSVEKRTTGTLRTAFPNMSGVPLIPPAASRRPLQPSNPTSRRTPPGSTSTGVSRRNSTDRRRSERDESISAPVLVPQHSGSQPPLGMAALGTLATSPSRTSLSSSVPTSNSGMDAYRTRRDRERERGERDNDKDVSDLVAKRTTGRRPSFKVTPTGPSVALSVSGPVITEPATISRKSNGNALVAIQPRKDAKRSQSDILPSTPSYYHHQRSTSLEGALASMQIDALRPAIPSFKPVPCPPSPETTSSGTITSDGGFTDYLSDESDAELQRQALESVARIELAKQTQYEENEFRIAREQLSTVGLQPPKTWNPAQPGVNPAAGRPVPQGQGSVQKRR